MIGLWSLPWSWRCNRLQTEGQWGCCVAVQVRGATTHYDAVVSAATNGVLNAGLNTGVPVVFGVLTTENMEQVNAEAVRSGLCWLSSSHAAERACSHI